MKKPISLLLSILILLNSPITIWADEIVTNNIQEEIISEPSFEIPKLEINITEPEQITETEELDSETEQTFDKIVTSGNETNIIDEEILFEWYLCDESDEKYISGRKLSDEEIALLSKNELPEIIYEPALAFEPNAQDKEGDIFIEATNRYCTKTINTKLPVIDNFVSSSSKDEESVAKEIVSSSHLKENSLTDNNKNEEILFEWQLCDERNKNYINGRKLTREEILLLGDGTLPEIIYEPLPDEIVDYSTKIIPANTKPKDDLFIESDNRYCLIDEEKPTSKKEVNKIDLVILDDQIIISDENINEKNNIDFTKSKDGKIEIIVAPKEESVLSEKGERRNSLEEKSDNKIENKIERIGKKVSLRKEKNKKEVSNEEVVEMLKDLKEVKNAEIVINEKSGEIEEPNYVFYALSLDNEQLDTIEDEVDESSSLNFPVPENTNVEDQVSEFTPLNPPSEVDLKDEDKSTQVADWWYGEDNSVLNQGIYEIKQKYSVTGKGITVAVIDTGVNMDHPDLIHAKWTNDAEIPYNNIDDDGNGYVDDVNGWDFYYEDSKPDDMFNHGTHIAGLIAAKDNDIGVIGVAPDSKILPLKVCHDNGECPADRIIEALDYALEKNVDVISIALGSPYYSHILKSKIDEVTDAGIIVVASSGNGGLNELYYPAAFSRVVSTGAVDKNEEVAYFSNTGEGLDFVSPGVNINSTSGVDSYLTESGTSESAGILAGVFALAREYFNHPNGKELVAAAKYTARDIRSVGYDTNTGYGLIDLDSLFSLSIEDILTIDPKYFDDSNTELPPEDIEDNPNLNPQASTADFKVQRGSAIMGTSSTTFTLNAGTDYTACTGSCFVRIVNTRLTGMGRTSGGGTQNADDWTVYISSANFSSGGSIVFTRHGTNAGTYNNRFSWEIIEYIGISGGNNEMKVLDTRTCTFGTTSTTCTGATVSSAPSNDADVAVFITGQANPDTTAADVNTCMTTSSWNGTNDQPIFTRREAGSDACKVSYSVVEFSGNNWTVERVEHTYASTNAETKTLINDVGDISRAFFHHQHRAGSGSSADGTGEQGGKVRLTSTNVVTLDLQTATSPALLVAVVWVISNSDTDSEAKMNVQHLNPADRTSAGASQGAANEEDEWSVPISSVTMNESSIMGETSASGLTTAYFPRGSITLTLQTETNVKLYQSEDTTTQQYAFQVVQWPRTLSSSTLTVGTTGTQTTDATLGTNDNYIGAFNFVSDGSQKVTEIIVSETGTVDETNLSNVDIRYETAGTCSYQGTETLFGTASSFSSSEAAISGSMTIGTSQVCVYVILDVGSGATPGNTIGIAINTPATKITVSTGIVSTSSIVEIAGDTIINGTLSVSLVQGDGASTATPTLAFAPKIFSFNEQSSTAKLGDDTKASALDQVIKVSNQTSGNWTLSLNFNGNTYWGDGTYTMSANSATTALGRLDVASISCSIENAVGGTSLKSANVICSSSSNFNGVTSVNLASATGAEAQYKNFFITDINLTQYIPAGQQGSAIGYSIPMNLTVIN